MTIKSRGRLGALAIFLTLVAQPVCAPAQDLFGTISGTHFVVKYMRGQPPEEARKVLDFLQSEYKSLNADVGLELKSKIEVRIYESVGKFLSETGQRRPWRAAYYQHNILHVQPVSALEHRRIFDKVLTYELALLLLDEAGKKGCPRWLMESFASYYSNETAGLTPPLGAKMTAFSDLNQDIQQYPNPPQREDVHYILASTMTFFVEKYGEGRAFRIFRTFDGMTPVDQVFKKVFGDDYASIEKSWAKYIEARTATFK